MFLDQQVSGYVSFSVLMHSNRGLDKRGEIAARANRQNELRNRGSGDAIFGNRIFQRLRLKPFLKFHTEIHGGFVAHAVVSEDLRHIHDAETPNLEEMTRQLGRVAS